MILGFAFFFFSRGTIFLFMCNVWMISEKNVSITVKLYHVAVVYILKLSFYFYFLWPLDLLHDYFNAGHYGGTFEYFFKVVLCVNCSPFQSGGTAPSSGLGESLQAVVSKDPWKDISRIWRACIYIVPGDRFQRPRQWRRCSGKCPSNIKIWDSKSTSSFYSDILKDRRLLDWWHLYFWYKIHKSHKLSGGKTWPSRAESAALERF